MSTDQLELLLATSLHENDSQTVDVQGGRSVLRERIERDQRLGRRRVGIGVAAAVLAVVVTASLVLTGAFRDERAIPVHPAPPKLALSPSGLPIGLLEGRVTRSSGRVEVANVKLRVFPDGTGRLAPGGITGDHKDFVDGFEVTYERLGPAHVAVRYDDLACASHYAFTMKFSVQGRTLTVLDAQPRGCLMPAGLVADLPGTTFRVSPLPGTSSEPPQTLSPSGLPVGLLQGQYERIGLAQLFQVLVRPDGTGQLSPGVGHSALAIGVAFDVRMRPRGPGQVDLVYDNPVLRAPEVVTLFFTTSASSVTVVRIDSPGNGVLTKADATAISGTRLQILPAPPSGLCCPG